MKKNTLIFVALIAILSLMIPSAAMASDYDFCADIELPSQVTVEVLQGPYPGAPVYFPQVSIVSPGGNSMIDGIWEGWCLAKGVDIDIEDGSIYLASTYLSYCGYPYNDLFSYPDNIAIINYILNNYTPDGYFTMEQIQRAIWEVLDNNFVYPNVPHAQEILTDAQVNGLAYVPGCGDLIMVIIAPEDAQLIGITMRIPCCYEETACAAQDQPGVTQFVDDNWFTYFVYDGDGEQSFPLYAGQTYLVGYVTVKVDENGILLVKYEITEEGADYLTGYCGEWKGLSEYHLEVADEYEGFNDIRTYNKKKGYGSPIPGQCEYSEIYTNNISDTGWIETEDVSGYGNTIYIFAHSVVWWCGYPCTE